MSKSSEMEFSDTSTSESFASTSGWSPLQQVPELPGGPGPELKILIQPQGQFRFRYESDNKTGSHGCIHGIDKDKLTYPTVELVNYSGRAMITCELIEKDSEDLHPHEITSTMNNQNVIVVPNKAGYKACFDDLKIISMKKKDVLDFVKNKYRRMLNALNTKQAKKKANEIDLDVVRLKFTAMDHKSRKVICSAVSDPINNEKSVRTNELKIFRCSRACGRVDGEDDVYILVSKVDKSKIEIRFYELNEKNELCWEDFGRFHECDVHYQCAIVFRTPPYIDRKITRHVKVFMELRRRTDGTRSQPIVFEYRANPFYMKRGLSRNSFGKKRKIEHTELMDSSYADIETEQQPQIQTPIAQNNVVSTPEVPLQVQNCLVNSKIDPLNTQPTELLQPEVSLQVENGSVNAKSDPLYIQPTESFQVQDFITDAEVTENNNIENNFFILSSNAHASTESIIPHEIIEYSLSEAHQPLWGDPMLSQNPSLLNPTIAISQQHISENLDEFEDLINLDEYYYECFTLESERDYEHDRLQNNDCRWKSDSGVKNVNRIKTEGEEFDHNENESSEKFSDEAISTGKIMKLIKEMRKFVMENRKDRRLVEEKMEQLLAIKLPNGDTYLHFLLANNIKIFLWIVKVICRFEIPHLCVTDESQRTILHWAAMLDIPEIVSLLVKIGCNPMVDDEEGNNFLHYAAMNSTSKCLENVLSTALKCELEIDLDAYNFAKQTPLHLAVTYGCAESVAVLLKHGACPVARDCERRTPLHLAAYRGHLDIARILLRHVSTDHIDDVDAGGLTALQAACEVKDIRGNTLEIIKLLLRKEANPLKCESGTQSAFELARKRPQVWKFIKEFENSFSINDNHIIYESDEEYFSADELVHS